MLHAVDLRQQLIHHRVVHARAAGARASLLADGVQLVEDDDVQAAVCSQLGRIGSKRKIMSRINQHEYTHGQFGRLWLRW